MQRTGVLLIHPQYKYASDSSLYEEIMRRADPSRFAFFVACADGPADDRRASINYFKQIPGVTVLPITFAPPADARSLKAPGRLLTRGALPMVTGLFQLAGLIRRHNIRIIHSPEVPHKTIHSLLLARLTGARLLVHLHVLMDDWIPELTRNNMRRADMVVTVSEAVKDSLVAIGVRAERIRVNLNGIDLGLWHPDLDGAPVRAELGIPAGATVLTIMSRIYPAKGHAEVIRALASLKHEVGDFRFLIVGTDDRTATPGGHSHTEELRALATDLGIGEQVIFTGFRFDAERILAASDIYAMPSPKEACSLAYMEAMAMRCPVIGVSGGGTPEVIEHGVTGLLSKPDDQAALTAHIRSLLTSPSLRTQMGDAGRRRVEQHFTVERMARDMERLYDLLLTDRHKAPSDGRTAPTAGD